MKQKFKEFTNQVMCRRSQNQNRARQIWSELKSQCTEKPVQLFIDFEIEWNHYLLEEITPDEFSREINKIRKMILL